MTEHESVGALMVPAVAIRSCFQLSLGAFHALMVLTIICEIAIF
jgi:hypothetical protein